MASFAHKQYFDARAYLNNRPKYGQECLDLITAWHEHQQRSNGLTPSYEKAVDLGCGPGQMSYLLSSKFRSVTGVDPSDLMIEAAKKSDIIKETIGLEVPAGHELDFIVKNAESSELPSESFDLISAATSSHWFPWKQSDPPGKMVWKEMNRLLKPGGSLCFMTYIGINLVGHDHIRDNITSFVSKDGEWGQYFELGDDLSATKIGSSFFKTMPKPTEPEFDSSSTIILRLDADNEIGAELEPSDITPLPSWVTSNTSIQSTSQPIIRHRLTFRQVGLFLRSTSAWPRYLEKHPHEKELEKDYKDIAFRKLDQWRREEAEITGGKMLEWDDVVESTAPCAFLFARKRA
ncbi:unnamed protein product [Sympodiomycopsis kandeliae]